MMTKKITNTHVTEKMLELYDDTFRHNGFAEMKIEIRILRKGQKEVIIYCGKHDRPPFLIPVKT